MIIHRLRRLAASAACAFTLTASGCDAGDSPFVPMTETHSRQEMPDGTIVHDHSTEYGLPDGTSDLAKSRTVTKIVRGSRSWETEADYRGQTLKVSQDEKQGTLTVDYGGQTLHLEQLASGHFRFKGETYPDNDEGRIRVGKAMADSAMQRRIPAGALWEGVRGMAIAQNADGQRLQIVLAIAAAMTAFCNTLAQSPSYQSFENNPADPGTLPGDPVTLPGNEPAA